MAGIYIHIPFCKQSCFYCDFHFSTSLRRKKEMLSAIAKELEIRRNELKGEIIETIYFGGGTPSLLSSEEIMHFLEIIGQNYTLAEHLEITLEANPDDLNENKIKELAETKINRLSIGIQSFFDDDLKMMNRAHNAKEAKKCLTFATKYFDNITVDLIYGIPKMSHEKWKENLQTVFDFNIPHISSYALTVEPKTVLQVYIDKGKYPDTDDALSKEHFDILVEETQKNGMVQYETSNFGKPNYFSKHNISYWLGKKYLGIGPSAHSFNKTHRSWNISSNIKYVNAIQKGILPCETEFLNPENQFNEYIMTGLRTIWGISLEKIKNDFGTTYLEYLLNSSKKYIDRGLLQLSENKITTTPKGAFLIDGIASDLFFV
ncbi:MAG: radical SAM family heme chaperone HemW [Flavobacteriaceae bacterium]|nr:radical SAM family heme chaperone HemW [Flavobacteriaceae bacterium]